MKSEFVLMTAEDKNNLDYKTSNGSPSSSSNNSSFINDSTSNEKQSSLTESAAASAIATFELEDSRGRSLSTASEGSQDSTSALLPEVSFGPIFEGLIPAGAMGSPSRHNYRENQPLLGNQRFSEIEDYNTWTGKIKCDIIKAIFFIYINHVKQLLFYCLS